MIQLIGYFLVLSTVILITKITYTLYFSPLRHIPGPFLGKLSGLYIKYYITIGKYHEHLKRLHDIYGPVVHFAPNRIIFNEKNAADTIYSSYKFKKSVFYQAFDYGAANIFSTDERTVHTERKKIIGKIISNKNIQQLEPVMKHTGFLPFKNFIKQKIDNKQNFVDFYELIHKVLFNINGQLLLSEDLGLLNENNELPILKWLKEAQVYGIMQYEYPIIRYFNHNKQSTGYNSYTQFINFCKDKVKLRMKQLTLNKKPSDYNDILQAFLNSEVISTDPNLINTLTAEIITGFIAGTDTTANTLTWALKCILEEDQVYEKIQKEIESNFSHMNDEDISYSQIKQACPYLEAVLYEAMRLYPVGAGFLPRVVPKEGAVLGSYFIPKDMEVGIGSYAYNRNEKLWHDANKFIPERFLGQDAKDKKLNYLPFLNGPRSCIGREFAWMAMYLTLVYMFKNFNFKLRPKYEELEPYFFLVLKPKQGKFDIEIENK
ncbi:cytochrome P450 [Neoconidiobolus thromboides FSU 785]|nr:cytochrome P450 [Neoconidiobolus thromboides FSU 785]